MDYDESLSKKGFFKRISSSIRDLERFIAQQEDWIFILGKFFHLEFESFLPCFEMMEMELDIIADQDFPAAVEL